MPRNPTQLLVAALLGSWCVAITLVVTTVALESAERSPIELPLDPARMQPELGRAFEIPLDPPLPWWLACHGDTVSMPVVSDLELFEQGTPLGPAHAGHPDIRTLGNGRFSHWHGRVIFSTSDGSDPRTNGRRYLARVTPRSAEWVGRSSLLALVAALVCTTLAIRRRPAWSRRWSIACFAAVTIAVVVAWNGVLWRFAPFWIAVQPDSASYLGDYSIRTVGYPALLWIVTAIGGDLRALGWFQINLLVLSLVALAASVAVALGRPRLQATPSTGERPRFEPAWGLGALLLAFMGTSTRIFETSFTVMTDGPFTALTCLLAAAFALAARRRSTALAFLCGAIMAIAILVRPVGIAFVPLALLPWWWHRNHASAQRLAWLRALVALALPPLVALVLVLGAASLRTLGRHGFFGLSSMGSVSLAGHVAWMISPETVPTEPELARHLQKRIAPLVASRPALAWPFDYYRYTSDEYNPLLWGIVAPGVEQWVDDHPPAAHSVERERERLLRELAVQPIIHRPLDYAQHVLANAIGATVWFGRGTTALSALAQAAPDGMVCLAALPPEQRRLFETWIQPPRTLTLRERWLWWERVRAPIDDRPSLYAIATIPPLLFGMLLWPWAGRRIDERSTALARWLTSPAVRLLGALSLMVGGSILLMSISATVILRYIDALDPLIASAAMIAWVLVARLLRGTVVSFICRSQSEKLTSESSRSP